MTRYFILSILFLAGLRASAQGDLNETRMVGFACFFEGRETKIVREFGKMLKHKRYTSIASELHSKNAAKRVMAVLCLEKLSATNKRAISDSEQTLINKIKTSKEPVDVCSGCFPNPDVPTETAFTSGILSGVDVWFERRVKN